MRPLQKAICLLLIFFKWTEGTNTGYVQQPMTVNTLLNQTGVATFTCIGYSLGSHWLVNDRLPEHASNSHRGLTKNDRTLSGYLKEHLLYIPTQIHNDGVSVQCFIYNTTSYPSNKVYLHIQGTLSTVSGVQSVQTNSSHILVWFTPPMTLTDVPIVNYSFILMGNTYWSNDNSTELTLTDYCNNHTITITPYNGLGPGESLNYTLLQYEVPFNISIVFSSISFVSNQPLFTTTSQDNHTECLGRLPTVLYIHLMRKTSGWIQTCSLITNNCSQVNVSDNGNITLKLSNQLTSNDHYQLILVFGNDIGNTTETTQSFSTFQTQSVDITKSTDLLCLTCYFAPGSTISGCHAVFVDTSGSHDNQTMTALRLSFLSGTDCEELLPGSYDVYVYDRDNGQIESEGMAAVRKQVIISAANIIPSLTATSTSLLVSSSSINHDITITSTNIILTGTSTSTSTSTSIKISVIPSNTIIITNPSGGEAFESMWLLIIAFVVGSFLTLTLLTVILLIYCLVKTKKKNKRLKIAEIEASERQRHAEVLLNTLTVQGSTGSLQRLYTPHSYLPPPLSPNSSFYPSSATTITGHNGGPVNPLYDSVEDAAYKKKILPEIQDCPAYTFPPPLLPPRPSPLNTTITTTTTTTTANDILSSPPVLPPPYNTSSTDTTTTGTSPPPSFPYENDD